MQLGLELLFTLCLIGALPPENFIKQDNQDQSEEYLVTCKFTANSSITVVMYNNKNITAAVQGDLSDWKVLKSVSFFEVEGASLVIGAHSNDAKPCVNCGLSIRCGSNSPSSVFNALTSRETELWYSMGSNDSFSFEMILGDDEDWVVNGAKAPLVCHSDLKLKLPFNGEDVSSPPFMWPSSQLPYALFRSHPLREGAITKVVL